MGQHSRASLSQPYGMNVKNTSNINTGAASSSNLSKTPENVPSSSECTDSTTHHAPISITENRYASDQETNIPNSPLQEKQQPPQNSSISTSSDLLPINRFRIGRRASTISRTEQRQREAMWDLFQSENAFLIDHLMVIKHVSSNKSLIFN